MTRKEKQIVDDAVRMCMDVYTVDHPGGLSPEQAEFVRHALDIMDRDMAKRNPKLHAVMLQERALGMMGL